MSARLERLAELLRTSRPDYYDELAPGLSQAEIERFEAILGLSLPQPFKDFYQWHDGQARDCYLGLWGGWELLDAEAVCQHRDEWNELVSVSSFREPNWWNPGWVPFAWDSACNYHVLDTIGCFGGQPGQVLEVWHDDPDRVIVWESFVAWVETLIAAHEIGYRNVDFEADDVDLEKVTLDEELFASVYRRLNPAYPVHASAADA
jgi:cell wall assembly regulator SMI1